MKSRGFPSVFDPWPTAKHFHCIPTEEPKLITVVYTEEQNQTAPHWSMCSTTWLADIWNSFQAFIKWLHLHLILLALCIIAQSAEQIIRETPISKPFFPKYTSTTYSSIKVINLQQKKVKGTIKKVLKMYSKSYDHCQTSYLPSWKIILFLNMNLWTESSYDKLKYHLTSWYNCNTWKQTHLPYSMQKRCSKLTYTWKKIHTFDPMYILHFINCFCTSGPQTKTHT